MAIVMQKVQHKNQPVISRSKFIMLDDKIAHELIHSFLRLRKQKGYDRKIIDLIVVGIKTLKPGKFIEIPGGKIVLTKRSARFLIKH